MAFVINHQPKAYFKRFQTKFRRRREGKTDYRARKRLVVQAKDKYNSPRFRFVVRFSNQNVTCQVIYADIKKDNILCSAHSSELTKYGIPAGHKNYAAAYCTGLLCAKRLLTNLEFVEDDGTKDGTKRTMVELYEGAPCDGRVRSVKYGRRTLYVDDLEWETERRPFRCNLDVGIKATTLGSRVFGALKGASDGGLDIPHNYKKFPGYNVEKKKYNASIHLDRIYGVHVAKYMEHLQSTDDAKYQRHFSKYIEGGIAPEDVRAMYENAHEEIRKNPSRAAIDDLETHEARSKAHPLQKKLSKEQRDQRVANKKKMKEFLAWKEDQESDEDEDDSDLSE